MKYQSFFIDRPKNAAVHHIVRSASPQQPQNAVAIPTQLSSPKNNRPNARAPPAYNANTNASANPTPIANANPNSNLNSNANNTQPNQYGYSAERTERRKFRVEKKLQEMQQTDISEKEREATRDDVYFDILEFAENNFNTHERTPEGTIIATLTRKGRKSVDLVPIYEMITYYRGNSIPTSHIHMYDPENVAIACNIFKVNVVQHANVITYSSKLYLI